MKKAILFVKTNILIYTRINSEDNPILYAWLRGFGIKMPPEILAYLIILSFCQMMFLGVISQMNDTHNKNPNLFYSGVLFLISMVAVEILIAGKKLQINSKLLKVLPFTKKNYVSYLLVNHFVSLRLWNLITFILLFIIFCYTYNNGLSFQDYIVPSVIWVDFFVLFCSVTLSLNDTIKRYITNKHTKMALSIRIFFILLLFVVIKKISKYGVKGKLSEVFPVYINDHLFLIIILSLLVSVCIIAYYFNIKSTSIS